MNPDLLPQPQRLRRDKGVFAVASSSSIGIRDIRLADAAREAKSVLKRAAVHIAAPGAHDALVLSLRKNMRPGGYRLTITPDGIRIEAKSPAAAFHATQTLRQIADQAAPGTLPCLRIEDWPDFRDRGVYYDVARGRVPKRKSLLKQADLLARFKVNHLQLYVEHTFRFHGHPLIGRGASPLTAEDILALDRHCLDRQIDLVPSLASFGHLAPVLRLKPYRHLAEDRGVGEYVEKPPSIWQKAFTLSPANPDTYRFLESLFSEFLPIFRSERFNACCDETWDLGYGQSYELCRKRGKGRVYLDHIIRLNEMSKRFGKRMMFWGDIIRTHPDLIPRIPRDVTVLDWGYAAAMDFDRIRDFARTGLEAFVCPSVSGYVSLFPRIHEARLNIHGWASAGARHGATGLLNTDWGDGGHYNFMECAWHGYLFAAEQSWNVAADADSFSRRFCRLFLNITDRSFVASLEDLGKIVHLACDGFYQNIWTHVFFSAAGDAPLRLGRVHAWDWRGGKPVRRTLRIDARLAQRTRDRLLGIRDAFTRASKQRGTDPHRVLPYWIFAVDALAHAARKLAVLGPGGRDRASERRALKTEMRRLVERFEALWLDRNRPSEIRITLQRCRRALDSL